MPSGVFTFRDFLTDRLPLSPALAAQVGKALPGQPDKTSGKQGRRGGGLRWATDTASLLPETCRRIPAKRRHRAKACRIWEPGAASDPDPPQVSATHHRSSRVFPRSSFPFPSPRGSPKPPPWLPSARKHHCLALPRGLWTFTHGGLVPPPSPPSAGARGRSPAGRSPSSGLASPRVSREGLLPRNQACRARATSPFKAESLSSAPAPLIPVRRK